MDYNLIKKLIEVHLGSQIYLYMSAKQEYSNFDVYLGSLIDDSYWNFATNIMSKTKEEFSNNWNKIVKVLSGENRQSVVYFTPLSPIYEKVNELNLTTLYTDSWLILKDISSYPYYKSKLELTIEKVNEDNIEKFIDAVCIGFSSDNPEDPYGELSEGYRIALRESIKVNNEKYKIQHYIASYNGIVVGTATANYDKEVACIYNVTTAKEYRKNGIAKELMSFLIKDMANRNIEIICLQTEKGFYTEEVYLKLGFEKVFEGIALGNEIKIERYHKHDDLIDFYVSREIEFNESKQYFHPPIFSYVAKINDQIVGAITVCQEGEDFILDELAVSAEHENQGIGTKLFEKSIEHIKKEYGNKKIYLVAKIPTFWERKGFKIIKREEAPSFSECFTCEEYQKTCFPETMLLDLSKL